MQLAQPNQIYKPFKSQEFLRRKRKPEIQITESFTAQFEASRWVRPLDQERSFCGVEEQPIKELWY